MPADLDTLLEKTLPDLARLWLTDPAAALRRSTSLQRLGLELAGEGAGQALDLARMAARRAKDVADRLCSCAGSKAGDEASGEGGRA